MTKQPIAAIPGRRILLGRELERALSTTLMAESHVRTATLAALWASSISSSHVATGQPYEKRVRPARKNAVDAIESVPDWNQIAVLQRWHKELSSDAIAQVADSDDLESLFRELLARVLTSEEASPVALTCWSREIAAILTETERAGTQFRSSLADFLAKERLEPGSTGGKIDELLWIAPESYLVALGVTGVKSISGVEELAGPHVTVLKDHDSAPQFPGWGSVGSQARDFVDFLCRPPQTQRGFAAAEPVLVVLGIAVDAAGVESAAQEARRVALRLIDALSAVHPSAQLNPSRIAGVGRPRDGYFSVSSFGAPTPEVIRAEIDMPRSPLREAMRAAALVRRLHDPMTQASFSWISFETAGFTVGALPKCGKALAMLMLRQHAISSYRQLAKGLGDISDLRAALEREHALAEQRVRSLTRHAPPMQSDRERVASLIAANESKADLFLCRAAEVGTTLSAAEEKINSLRVCKPGLRFRDKNFTQITDMESWQEQIETWPANLGALVNEIPSWSTTSIRTFAPLLRSSEQRNSWLRETSAYFARLLDGLYSARNVHLHSGLSDVPGSVLLGQFAPMLTDALLELCLNWERAGSSASPREVISTLAERFDDLVENNPASVRLDEMLMP